MALFPQLVAGPIIRYKDLYRQLRKRPHTFAGFSEGGARFMIGFCKKVLIADLVAPIANAAFGLASPTAADAWLGALAYTVQIYFDFSGYSDMAVGLGLMMGFRFPENFRSPYLSRSITEFWRRWHISLSTWLRDYLYIPLGGNRRGPGRTLVNLLVVMVLGGLWHGAAWTFILWGAWHGLLLAIERRRRLPEPEGPRLVATAATMAAVIVGWVLFRSASVQAALAMYAGMIGLHGLGVSDALRWQLGGPELAVQMAEQTATSLAPAAATEAALAGVMPPMATIGRPTARATSVTSWTPTAGPASLVPVGKTGPTEM
jgi:alginate O-acetyltransferase complex protein AlgI